VVNGSLEDAPINKGVLFISTLLFFKGMIKNG